MTTTTAPSRPARGRRREPGAPLLSSRTIMAISLVLGAIAWELVGRFVLDEIFFASFSRTLAGAWEMIQAGVLQRALTESLALFGAGFGLGAALGLFVGVLIGRIEVLATALEDYLTLAYITPPIVAVPFVLSIIGYGFWPKTLVVMVFVFFPVCITTIEGVRAVNKKLLEVAKSFRASEARIWRDIIIPSTVPYSMSGIRQGIALGLVGVVAAEYLLDATGIGRLLNTYSRTYRMDQLLATVMITVVIGLLGMALGRMLERRFAPWRQ